jgi:hypothetical protein
MKPRRLPNTLRALTAWELNQINAIARASGNDTILDALPLRLHAEAAYRRGGALAIRLQDLDTDRCLVHTPQGNPTNHTQTANPQPRQPFRATPVHRGGSTAIIRAW